MNSLAYLSRQLDSRFSGGAEEKEAPVRRVPTWSAFPPFRPLSPKRSSSSPAIFSPNVSSSFQSSPPSGSPISHIFFIRLFILVWSNLVHAWSSLMAQFSLLLPHVVHPESPSDVCSVPSVHRFTIDHQPAPAPSTPKSESRPTTQPGIHRPKTLVLDLDETLIHSTSRPMHTSTSGGLFGLFGRRNTSAGHMVEVVLQGKSTLYHVYKRPFVDFFLRTVRVHFSLSNPFIHCLIPPSLM